MAGFTVFYSWQNDLPRNVGRDFIQDAAQTAIDRLAEEIRLEASPRLDHDTKGVSGVPPIGDTILAKIDHCGVFLADVSIIGKTKVGSGKTKYSPNPNVLLELGYAAARVGWGRLIFVMNTHYGAPKRLPFDLRYRRFPFLYRLDPTAQSTESIQATRQELASGIEFGIRMAMDSEHQRVAEIIRRLDGFSLKLMSQHGPSSHFWETSVDSYSVMSTMNLAISNLLALGVIECVSCAEAPSGHAYTWTYIGRQCLERLGFALPPVILHAAPIAQSFPVDLSWYDHFVSTIDDGLGDGNSETEKAEPASAREERAG